MNSKKTRTEQIKRQINCFKLCLEELEDFDIKTTMPLKDVRYYMDKYSEIMKVLKDLIVLMQQRDISDITTLSTRWKQALIYQLVRNFNVPDNAYYSRVSDPEDGYESLKQAILENEEILKSRIKVAVDFFGNSFLHVKLFADPNYLLSVANEADPPVTVEEVLKTSVTDWTRLTINRGFPVPYYHSMWNDNLPRLISMYVNQL